MPGEALAQSKTGVEVRADGEIFCQGWVVVVEDFA
jgi:hypothetical protein